MKHEECKGCIMSRYNNQTYCTYYLLNKSKECPCITCLVKVMCDRLCVPRRYIGEERVAEVSLVNGNNV